MIVSRPQTKTIVAFTVFLILTIVVLSMNILVLIKDPQPAWYTYLIIGLMAPVGLFVLYKIFIRYKIVQLGKNQVEVNYPVLRSKKNYPIEQIDTWVEHQVKTGANSTYKEVEIRFKDGVKLSLGHKEYTEYPRIIQYLIQKAAKKKGADA